MAAGELPVRSVEEVIAAVPFLVGHHPQDSLILVLTDSDGRLLLTVRADLPVVPLEDVDEAVRLVEDGFAERVREAHATDAVVLTWREQVNTDRDRVLIDGVVSVLTRGDVSVVDAVATNGSRATSYLPNHRAIDGKTHYIVTAPIRDVVAEVAAEVGIEVAASRDELSREWTARSIMPQIQEAAEFGFDHVADHRFDNKVPNIMMAARKAQLQEVEWITGALSGPTMNAAALTQAARLFGKATAAKDIRDAMLVELDTLEPTDLRAYARNTASLARAMPESVAATAATLAGAASWFSGDGARAAIALEYALSINPDASLADSFATAVSAGMPPDRFREVVIGRVGTTADVLGVSEPAATRATELTGRVSLRADALSAIPPSPAPSLSGIG